jgi:(E)-4-hydroxy-3-methylbut-2-enyl-diphosphate synthase
MDGGFWFSANQGVPKGIRCSANPGSVSVIFKTGGLSSPRGVTEAGRGTGALVKSSIGIGYLLSEGIGDTIRVSLTGEPVQEVIVGYEILRALKLRQHGVEIIACPTCGRCEIDVTGLVRQIEKKVRSVTCPLTVAIMGCVVNGPGEAREADLGIAGGKRVGVLFRKGEIVKKIKEKDFSDVLLREIRKMMVEDYEIGSTKSEIRRKSQCSNLK